MLEDNSKYDYAAANTRGRSSKINEKRSSHNLINLSHDNLRV